MKIAIGADHGGYKLKGDLIKFLKEKRYSVKDFGTYSDEACDYPLIGYDVAKAVSRGKYQRGILICKTGIGMSMVANKVRGARAALCDRVDIASSSRMHNGSNILVLAAAIVSSKKAKEILEAWLKAPSPIGRHKRRVSQINRLEKIR
ncbi:MAG: ribose 5-phosphate isomerase B [Candidatus Omnitrophota bacterium]